MYSKRIKSKHRKKTGDGMSVIFTVHFVGFFFSPFKSFHNFFLKTCLLFFFFNWLTTGETHPIHLLLPKMHQNQGAALTQKAATS